ncbi:hypothetical protein ACFQUZ_12285 [Plantactinospora sp. GCM10030261]
MAGAGVVSAAAAGPAQAAPGEPVVQGQTVTAGATTTGITSSGTGATLQLANTRLQGDFASPALRMAPSGIDLAGDAPLGSIGMDEGYNLRVATFEYDGSSLTDYVHTSGNANRIVPIQPQRVIDTRSAASRARIINAAGNLDSSGRVIGGRTIHVDLSDFLFYADAVFGNLTVVSPVAGSFLTLYPYGGSRPVASSINFSAGAVLSNAYAVGVGYDDNYSDAVSIFSGTTAHVILDITAAVVGVGEVEPLIMGAGAARGAKAQSDRAVLAKKGKPSWRK